MDKLGNNKPSAREGNNLNRNKQPVGNIVKNIDNACINYDLVVFVNIVFSFHCTKFDVNSVRSITYQHCRLLLPE